MLNSSRVSLAPTTFGIIIGAEIVISIVACILIPFMSEAFYNAGVIHRNFRIQIRIITAVLFFSVFSRCVLLYYQLFDIPLDDYDYFLIINNIMRDTSFGTSFFALERSLATFFWKWYKRQTPDTMIALFVIELSNIIPAIVNSTGWLLGRWTFTFNVLFILFTVIIGAVVSIFQLFEIINFFLTVYVRNRLVLRGMSITISTYSLAKTFQIRENCRIMEFMMRIGFSVWSTTAVGFGFFCYYKWGPDEWQLSRYISIALFDVFI
ncbi:hypothetical protein PMAYCL1PPCAC_05315, partial [Pristionchus mayeri]